CGRCRGCAAQRAQGRTKFFPVEFPRGARRRNSTGKNFAERCAPVPAAGGSSAVSRGPCRVLFVEIAQRVFTIGGIDATPDQPGGETGRTRAHGVSNRSSRPSIMPRNAW